MIKAYTFAFGAKVVATKCNNARKLWSGLAVRFAVFRIARRLLLRCDAIVTVTNMTRTKCMLDDEDDHDIQNDDNKDRYISALLHMHVT